MSYSHCKTCACHALIPSPPVQVGDVVRDRLTGMLGTVKSVQEPNPPWHNGGTPFVRAMDGSQGWWHYYDKEDWT